MKTWISPLKPGFSSFAFIRVHLRPILLLLLLPLSAAPVLGRQRTSSDAAFSPETIRAEIAYLASDELRGRGSGEPGNEAAARFIAHAFARSGLKPLGTDRQRDPNAPINGSGYFQP